MSELISFKAFAHTRKIAKKFFCASTKEDTNGHHLDLRRPEREEADADDTNHCGDSDGSVKVVDDIFNNNNNNNNNNNKTKWTKVGTFTWCSARYRPMVTFKTNRPIDTAALWKAQTPNPLHFHHLFPLAEGVHSILHICPFVLKASDVEVNQTGQCAGDAPRQLDVTSAYPPFQLQAVISQDLQPPH